MEELEEFLTVNKLPLVMTFNQAKILFIPISLTETERLIIDKKFETIKAWFYKKYNIQLYTITRVEFSYGWKFVLGFKVSIKIKNSLEEGIFKGEITNIVMRYVSEDNIVKLGDMTIYLNYGEHSETVKVTQKIIKLTFDK